MGSHEPFVTSSPCIKETAATCQASHNTPVTQPDISFCPRSAPAQQRAMLLSYHKDRLCNRSGEADSEAGEPGLLLASGEVNSLCLCS